MVHAYRATILWQRGAQPFTDNKYTRGHVWRFDEGVEVPASSSPFVVPDYSVAAAVDPEEAFVASLSSCHMLFFLNFARRAGFVIDSYVDEADGELAKGADGKMAMTRVTLHPRIAWVDEGPDPAALADLHHKAHEACFIANSVTTEVTIQQ
jgi:organic hydroperoxide reductase OsmC/OhrA